jgi:hypothetical protein
MVQDIGGYRKKISHETLIQDIIQDTGTGYHSGHRYRTSYRHRIRISHKTQEQDIIQTQQQTLNRTQVHYII